MAYGTVKVDNITFDNGGSDQNVTTSGIYRAITSGITVTGTISGAVVIGSTSVSGTTVAGTTANFSSGIFTTQVSGVTVTGTTSDFTSGNFVSLSGVTATFTSGVIASGTAAAPSLSIVGDGNTGIYSPGADQLAVATNGTQRLTVDTAATTSTLPIVHPLGAVGTPSITFTGDLNTGIYSPTADTIAFAEGGVEAMRLNSSGFVGIGTSSPVTRLDLSGNYGQNIVAVAALNIDCSTGNYFTKTINGASTFTVSSVPASRSYSFTLELTHTSGAITWFSGVEWPGGTAPTLTTGKTHLFMFVTDDGGSRWRGASLINYTN